MRIWPFTKRPAPVEERQTYTDAVVLQILANAGKTLDGPESTSALEIAAGVMGRAFAAGRVRGDSRAAELTSTALADIGRDLVTLGESVWIYRGGWLRSSSWDIAGRDPRPDRWFYKLQVPVPDGNVEYMARGGEVLHARYSTDRSRPWVGIPPMERARLAGTLFASMETRMGEEAGGAVGHLLPVPTDGQDESIDELKADLAQLKGKTAVVETTAGGWGQGRQAAPQSDYQTQRIGAEFTQQHVPVYSAVQLSILAACGVPVELVAAADGTGQREAWRRFLHGTLQPLGRMLGEELARVTGSRAELDFEGLFASDIAGRARAFQSMVAAGMPMPEAAANSGLMGMEE